MHILVVNDDGPPCPEASPYVHSFIRALQDHGHVVSVVLPTVQRSWIGKAHFVNQDLRPKYYIPGELSYTRATGTVSDVPQPAESDVEEWLLVDGTPASCTQVGLHHHFADRGPIDLVVSGPNYGRNSTAVFALSSGTIGGALEAAICGFRAIALSFAFFEKDGIHVPEVVEAASRMSVRVIETVMKDGNWPQDAHLLAVNVPLVKGVDSRKAFWTEMLQNTWLRGSSQYQEETIPLDTGDEKVVVSKTMTTTPAEGTGPEQMEQVDIEVRAEAGDGSDQTVPIKHARYIHKMFRWSPNFHEVHQSVKSSGPGSDGWTVDEGYTSITPLRANFMHVPNFKGEFEFS